MPQRNKNCSVEHKHTEEERMKRLTSEAIARIMKANMTEGQKIQKGSYVSKFQSIYDKQQNHR
ncbi:hypothetical protein [Celerinatantimonas sp. YJH-8]|uniref:hypothetical protein n=1 Tax=Celerinatantimonas sp. YJH-8 TaxID=3228714 RepID=UPI0038BFD8A5